MNKIVYTASYAAIGAALIAFVGGVFASISLGIILFRMFIVGLIGAILGAGINIVVQNHLPELLTLFTTRAEGNTLSESEMGTRHGAGDNINIILDDEIDNNVEDDSSLHDGVIDTDSELRDISSASEIDEIANTHLNLNNAESVMQSQNVDRPLHKPSSDLSAFTNNDNQIEAESLHVGSNADSHDITVDHNPKLVARAIQAMLVNKQLPNKGKHG